MLRLTAAMVLIASLCCGGVSVASNGVPRETRGLEWLESSIALRMESVLYSMALLSKNGIELSRSPNDYYNAIDTRLKADPQLYASDITQILAQYVYETEPNLRKSLDAMRVKNPSV